MYSIYMRVHAARLRAACKYGSILLFWAAAFQLAFGSVIRLNVPEPKRPQKGVLGNPRLSGFGRWWLSVYPGRGVVRRRHEEQALTR